MDRAAQIVAVIAAVMSIINLFWLWHSQARMPTENALKAIRGDVDDHEARIKTVELEMRHLPTKDDLSKVQLSLTELLGQLKVVENEVSATARTLRRMEDHLRSERA